MTAAHGGRPSLSRGGAGGPARGGAEDLAGLRPTRQRLAIMSVLDRAGIFLSAQAVHEAVERSGTHVGLSTIYRSLQALSERGAVDATRGVGTEMLYRKCADHSSDHAHLVCRGCGVVVEIPIGAIKRLIRASADAAGFTAIEHVLDVVGTCARCPESAR